MTISFDRFLDAQQTTFAGALTELRAGSKRSHWMWYIFPQIAGLGRSDIARHYAIRDLAEARAYLRHPVLGARLDEASAAMLGHPDRSADAILGPVDAMKLRSSMTLFHHAADPGSAARERFRAVLATFFGGQPDSETLRRIA